MPLPDWLARVNRRLTNPLFGPAASRLPFFALIHHRGRVTGRLYRTPVNAFATDDGFVVALTYGHHRDWVRNVLAAGGCVIVHRGRRLVMTAPRLIGETESGAAIPSLVRFVLDVLRVKEFVRLDTEAS